MATDWKQLITDLHGIGMDDESISAAIGEKKFKASAVKEIRRGRTNSPRYSAAVKLLALHKRRMRQARAA